MIRVPAPIPARSVILRIADGTRLSGAYSETGTEYAKGLVILIHGWEGGISSTYIQTTCAYLLRHGFDVFRLNLRDHGDTHHLNRGLFYATLFDEVYEAVLKVSRLVREKPVFIGGFSLGGNFALRIAHRWSQGPEKDVALRHVIAISPALDPSRATDAIDAHPIFRRYFLRKWRRSLRIKQQLFPDAYDFTEILRLNTLREMTEMLVRGYSPYTGATEYFTGYTVDGEALGKVAVPTSILTSRDDPIIPVADFYQMPANPHIDLKIETHGGHNGFVNDWRGSTWYESFILNILLEDRSSPGP